MEIPNPFFDEVYKYLIEENGGKQFYRDKHGWGTQDIWYGGGAGDKQVCKIKSAKGPRLKMSVEIVDSNHTKSVINDSRDYIIDGGQPKFIIIENQMQPSFKAKNKNNKL